MTANPTWNSSRKHARRKNCARRLEARIKHQSYIFKMEWLRQHRSYAITSIHKIMLDIYCKLCVVEGDNNTNLLWSTFILLPNSGGREQVITLATWKYLMVWKSIYSDNQITRLWSELRVPLVLTAFHTMRQVLALWTVMPNNSASKTSLFYVFWFATREPSEIHQQITRIMHCGSAGA